MLIVFHTLNDREATLPSLSIFAVVPSADSVSAVQALVFGLVGMAILIGRRDRLRGTTLTAAWWWTVLSLGSVTAVTVGLAFPLADAPLKLRQSLYFAAATTTFCPLMAVLGAKRPQHRAWQWIVLTLWVVLALPSGQWLLFSRGGDIHAARSWFLVILIGVGTLNYLPTRFWLASLLFAAAEVVLLARFLPGGVYVSPLAPHLPLGLFAAALAAAAWLSGRRAQDAEPLDRAWRDFRNLFGTLWALRLAERIHVLADQGHWNIRLGWSGFRALGGRPGEPVSDEVRGPLTKNLRSLLLPFVSSEWITQRLE